jgi:hypothetical protein
MLAGASNPLYQLKHAGQQNPIYIRFISILFSNELGKHYDKHNSSTVVGTHHFCYFLF